MAKTILGCSLALGTKNKPLLIVIHVIQKPIE